MSTSLKQQTISGMLWSAVQRFGSMVISFVTNIVLARLLSPDDYGCIGMLAIFITVSNTFVDGGFGSALIQKKEPTHKDYSTVFWWNLFLSIVLYIILYSLAPAIARFYHIPLLTSVLRVQGIILVFHAFSIIQSNQLRKQLNFKLLAQTNIMSHIIAAVVAVALACKGWGIWALVFQQLIASFFIVVILWYNNNWRPDLFISISSLKQLFGFGSFILCSNLVNTFCSNVQGLLIGRFFAPAIMGYYTQAQKLEMITSHTFTNIIEQVSYPVLARFQTDNYAMKSVLYKLVSSLVYISFPLMSVLILEAETLITFLYGEKWLPSVPFLQIFCVAGMSVTFHGVHYYAVASKGKSRDLFIGTIVKRILALIAIVVGMLLYQIEGLIWGSVIGAWIIAIVNAWLVSKHIGYTLYQQFKDLLPILLLTAITFLIVHVMSVVIECNMYIESIIILSIYILLYVGLSVVFKMNSFLFIKEIIFSYLKRKK